MSDPAPEDEYEECPRCGHDEIATWVDTVEVGKPLNDSHKPVAEAPRYRTTKARFFYCKRKGCHWGKP
jgi:hypothetical protein